MRKNNKLYIILAILALVFLFTIAATCNQCKATAEEGLGVSEGEGEIEEETEEDKEEAGEEAEEEETEEEAEEEEEETEEEEAEEVAEEDKEAPTIKLVIYEGPTIAGNKCYYRVEAKVTGNPIPDVEFSRDDSNGAWGEFKAQINISDPADTYTLTATATNLEGSVNTSKTFDWGCPVEVNNEPEIIDIIGPPMTGHFYTGKKYMFSVTASDPDGDTLNYSWSVSGGSMDSASVNPMKWNTPQAEGTYEITVTVDDGKGGTDTMTDSYRIYKLYEMNVPKVESEGGTVELNGRIWPGWSLFYAGDTDTNKTCKGFISFDISSLRDVKIELITLEMNVHHIFGDPLTFANKLSLNNIEWGNRGLVQGDFWITGEHIGNYSNPDITLNPEGLDVTGIGTLLQQAVDAEKLRLQFSIHFTGSPSDNDNNWDGWKYLQSGVELSIGYINK
jgi:hypothetical protein